MIVKLGDPGKRKENGIDSLILKKKNPVIDMGEWTERW